MSGAVSAGRPGRFLPSMGLPPEPLARAIERYMRAHCLTRTEFAREVGTSERTLRRWGVASTTLTRSSEVPLVHWATVDEVITRMDMVWFDVFCLDTCDAETASKAGRLLANDPVAV